MSTPISTGALLVLQIIASYGPICPNDICKRVKLSPRTVTLALKTLVKKDLCKKVPNLVDMRKPLYFVRPDRARPLLREYGLDAVIRTPPAGLGWRP
jgi:DNA-binding MarR family transcriptional regulator